MHDKYALFIWPAYAATALAFAWMVLDTLVRARAWRRRAERLEQARGQVDESHAEPAPSKQTPLGEPQAGRP